MNPKLDKTYTRPHSKQFPKPKNLYEIISNMKRVKSPEIRVPSMHNMFSSKKSRQIQNKWDFTCFTRVSIHNNQNITLLDRLNKKMKLNQDIM
mmetsp:Transcript_28318/g.25022  ORF Transcript_28318/g.25022 Transcript_28318/m.25022 type:complete len:93 (+) Transcript_28318:411-689(+)